MKAFLLLLMSLPAFGLVIDCGSATDQFFVGGDKYTILTTGATGDLTVRYGTFLYSIPATGPQIVRLVFRETGTVTGANQRTFTVKFNEESPVLSNWDLYSVYGLTPTERVFVRMPSDGFININFSYQKKSAIVSEIDVTPLTQPPQSTPVVTGGFGIVVSPTAPYQVSVDTSALNTLYDQLMMSATYSAGATKTFVPSSREAGIRIVCNSIPQTMLAVSIGCDPVGNLFYFNGGPVRYFVTSATPQAP